MKKWLRWTTAAWCLLASGSAYGAGSLDCAKATSKVEKLICGDEELLRLDAELARVYAKAMETITKKPETLSWKGMVKGSDWRKWLTREQALWLEDRDQCEDAACVGKRYRQRISRISGKLGFEDEERQYSKKEDEETCLPPRTDWRNYQWTLIVGNGRTSCEEMLAFLKSRPRDASPPICPEERLPATGNWARPEWRELSEAEKEALIRDMPEKYRRMPLGATYEQMLKGAKRMRVVRTDITRDGVPETLLAYSGDYRQACGQATRCAVTDSASFHEITLRGSDQYDLLPMNEKGTQVDWEHRLVGHLPRLGELVFYKGRPYWLSGITWSQGAHDNFALYNNIRPDDPWSNIFTLKPLHYGRSEGGDTNAPAEFNNLNYIIPGDDDGCWFGYFHRDNLKQYPVRTRR